VADKLNRVTPIEADKRRYRECLAREEAQRKLDAMLAENVDKRRPVTSVATLHATPLRVDWYGCCEALLWKDAGCVPPQ